jgi:hypothetical protein
MKESQMAMAVSSENLINRSLAGLFLPFRPTLSRHAAHLLGIPPHIGGKALDYLPIDGFGPDVVLLEQDSSEIQVVIETKLFAAAQATALLTVQNAPRREGDERARAVHDAVADSSYGVRGGKINARGVKPDGVWQIDAYFGWKWWDKDYPQLGLAPDAQFIYLSLDGAEASAKYDGAASAEHWRAISLVDLVMGLNRALRREQDEDFVPNGPVSFTQDEKDAIAVLTFLVYTHLGGEHVSPLDWVETALARS